MSVVLIISDVLHLNPKDFSVSFIPVLLCGGVGSRLWPLSREARPKQYLNLVGNQSMLQQTLQRLMGLDAAATVVVCNEDHRFLVAEQLRDLGHEKPTIVLEPEGKNTAPAIALAALSALLKEDDPTLLILPADHYVGDCEALKASIREATTHAEQGRFVTFGVQPRHPETGYGYIEAGEAISSTAASLERFVEKPDVQTAMQYVDSGNFLWNSGMFMFKAHALLEALGKYQPTMLRICKDAFASASFDFDFVRPAKDIFGSCPAESIDYAVMEHIDDGVVVALDCDWSDLGAWSTVWEVSPKDKFGNCVSGDVILEQTRNTYVKSESRLVTACGVNDLIIVESADAVMVADRDSAQDVKTLVSALRADGRLEADVHSKVFRPWGSYETLISGIHFQVKRIIVDPGQRLSLQLHHHRAEHWVVVAGCAEVENAGATFALNEGESTYIAVGAKHRLSNHGNTSVELIEVQSGTYLGEDDIVRFDDIYGRLEG